ncbi:MAG: hypothetical protein HN368_04430 [Spirochaetales bacterium]|jgi:hypothetical protein|nr:hypothetical protein [Spirochaetales bacterium]
MARRQINFDKTEIVVGFAAGKKYQVLNLSYADIQRIQFDSCTEMKLFRKVPSEKITIQTGKRSEPIVYTKLKNEPFWEEYKKGFTKFAENNNITFADNS